MTASETRGRLGHDDARFSAVVFVLALLPRIYVAIAWPREPVWDGHYYDFGARRIAAGFGYSDGVMGQWHPWCHWPVGFSGALALVYAVFGATPRVATLFNAVVGAALAAVTHRVARYGLCTTRARIAALLVAAFPGLIIYSALVMSEPLSALLLLLAGWAWLHERAEHPRRGAAIGGVLLGGGTLVHPSFLAYAPALLLIEWALLAHASGSPAGSMSDPSKAPSGSTRAHRGHALREATVRAAIATACAFAVVLPWTARNCRVMDRCTLVSTNGGWNLAIGAFERATGRFETLRSSDGCRVVTGQVQQDSCWRDLALQEIRRDPARWLSLIPKKLGFTFDHESFPVEYLHEADPDRWPEARRQRGRAWLTALHRLLLSATAFAAVGCPLQWRQPNARAGRTRLRPVWGSLGASALIAALCATVWQLDMHPFWVLAVVTPAIGICSWRPHDRGAPLFGWIWLAWVGTLTTHAVFFGEDRYHIVVTPLMCIVAAAVFRAHAEFTSSPTQPASISN